MAVTGCIVWAGKKSAPASLPNIVCIYLTNGSGSAVVRSPERDIEITRQVC